MASYLAVEVGARTTRASVFADGEARELDFGDGPAGTPSLGARSGAGWTVGRVALVEGAPENLVEALPGGVITGTTRPLVGALIASAARLADSTPSTVVLLHPSWWDAPERELLTRAARDVVPGATIRLLTTTRFSTAAVVVEVDVRVTVGGRPGAPDAVVSALGAEDAVVDHLLEEVPAAARFSDGVLHVLAGWALRSTQDSSPVVVRGLGAPASVPASVVAPALDELAGSIDELLRGTVEPPGPVRLAGDLGPWETSVLRARLEAGRWQVESSDDPLYAVVRVAAILAASVEWGLDPGSRLGAAGVEPARRRGPDVDEVQYSVYRPARVMPARWWPLLVFVHRAEVFEDPDTGRTIDPIAEVRRRAERAAEDEPARYGLVTGDGHVGLVRGTELTVVPSIEGGEVNPPQAVLRWEEPVHQVDFRARVLQPRGEAVRGMVQAYRGVVLVAEVAFRVPVGDPVDPVHEALVPSTGRAYRDVFVSYSHRDTDVVLNVIDCCRATGDRFLMDTLQLRSGERWEPALREMISRADVFQLFWSHHAMRSDQVRREWEFALGLGRESFVRPVYWERPRPADPALGLPPPELDRLHWHALPAASFPSRVRPSTAGDGAPATARPAPSAPRPPAGPQRPTSPSFGLPEKRASARLLRPVVVIIVIALALALVILAVVAR